MLASDDPPVKGTTTLELPRRAGSAGIARLIVTAHGASLPAERLKSANLMVSELVTQRLQARRGPDRADRRSGPDGVRAEVPDEGAGGRSQPVPRPPRGGWGLIRRPARGLVGRRGRRVARVVPGRRRSRCASSRVEVCEVELVPQAARQRGVLSCRRARARRPAARPEPWIVARAALRIVLGERLGVAPDEVAFALGQHGKPELPGSRVRFNLRTPGTRD